MESGLMNHPITIENTQELRDALYHAICLLDHACPENDTDHRDVAGARQLKMLRNRMNLQAYGVSTAGATL